ncbi:hypothetical protein AB0M02_33155 [Actinoplanes sp. NPDC051861]|uniref:hypothetical protein n=1 Tax=Actinoplanes sp. NPDC051861 TaxID=3155170 RepID=UPI00341FD407
MDADDVRRIFLELPEAEEYEHGGLPAFRVRGKRFASMLSQDSVHLMLGEDGIREAAAEWPQWCSVRSFGQRLSSADVRFATIDPDILRELATDAWARRAPKSLSRAPESLSRAPKSLTPGSRTTPPAPPTARPGRTRPSG